MTALAGNGFTGGTNGHAAHTAATPAALISPVSLQTLAKKEEDGYKQKNLKAQHEEQNVPADMTAEMAVIGAMLLGDIDANIEASERQAATEFYYPANGAIFRAMQSLIKRGEPVDIVTVKDELARARLLEKCGGVAYLMELADFVPTTVNLPYYQAIVTDKSLRRNIIAVCANIGTSAKEGDVSGVEALETLKRAVTKLDVMSARGRAKVCTMQEAVLEGMDFILNGGNSGYKLGIPELDRLLGGLRKGETTIVGARPGTGKTALSISWTMASAEAGAHVLFVSGEMPKRAIISRMAYQHAKINPDDIRARGHATPAEVSALKTAFTHIESLPISFVDASSYGGQIDAPGIISLARRQQYNSDACDMIVVDYLQKIRADPRRDYGGNRQVEVQEISQILSTGFLELDVAGLVLAQLSRAAVGVKPSMDTLRESGAIEADANNILLLWEEEEEKPGEPGYAYTPAVIGVNLDKQRDGRKGCISLAYDKRVQRFAPITTSTPEEGGYITNATF